MPNVWLVRSPGVAPERFSHVVNLLQAVPGILSFHEGIMEGPDAPHYSLFGGLKLEWFFRQCSAFRRAHDIGDQELVVYLSDLPNMGNYFNGIDFEGGLDVYVQSSGWDHYFTGSDERYPLAFHIALSILIRYWFSNLEEAEACLHRDTTGCIMDYCGYKPDVSLKLRTADICPECLDSIRQAGIDPNIVNHVLQILEEVRRNMLFKSRWSFDPKPLVLSVEGEGRELYFPELGSMKVELRPLQRALYLFYLERPEGVPFSQLHCHEDAIFEIYNAITGNQWHEMLDKKQYDQTRQRIRNLADMKKRDTCDRSIRYIREAFEKAVGRDAAQLYCISGPRGGNRKIAVDRQYVQYQKR